MVLISSSTVSVVISSSVISLFTLLLFLSGLFLQQRSVRSIQAVIRPTDAPKISHWPPQARPFYTQKLANSAHSSPDLRPSSQTESRYNDKEEVPKEFWDLSRRRSDDPPPSQQAVVQVLSRPSASDICSSILLFRTLASNSSIRPQQVLLYPQSWDSNPPMRSITSALEVLRASSDEYNVVLHPLSTRGQRGRAPSEVQLLKDASAELMQYEWFTYLRAPGLLVDARKIDELFNATDPEGDSGKAQYWTHTRFSTKDKELPPAVLVTLQASPSQKASVATHVLEQSTQNEFVDAALPPSERSYHNPAYVYFRRDITDRREEGSLYYKKWRQGLESICPGIDISH